jgi:hypothetical protein
MVVSRVVQELARVTEPQLLRKALAELPRGAVLENMGEFERHPG